jgi:predicted carbohydrate-binding protein with CBM5 and CBM33 domain
MICNLRTLVVATVSIVSFLGTVADAHTYVTISRGQKCSAGLNSNCGLIVYEPQSLEAPKGYPNAGPPDGKIASANVPRFIDLDQQSATRWHKTNVQQGSYTFTWQYTARHVSTGYQYFITRTNWNPNAPLTRSQFETAPFCSINSGGALPPMTDSHPCNLPSRSGYHVILAVWTVADTANAFYNVIDVQYSGTAPAPSPVSAPVAAPTTSGTGSLGDWSVCSSSNQCRNQCCSGRYSGGVLKCTPLASGFDPVANGCVGSSTTTTKLGDWATCSNSNQCANQCCSGTYSGGVLKCTPLNGGYRSDICIGSPTRHLRVKDDVALADSE